MEGEVNRLGQELVVCGRWCPLGSTSFKPVYDCCLSRNEGSPDQKRNLDNLFSAACSTLTSVQCWIPTLDRTGWCTWVPIASPRPIRKWALWRFRDKSVETGDQNTWAVDWLIVLQCPGVYSGQHLWTIHTMVEGSTLPKIELIGLCRDGRCCQPCAKMTVRGI